MTTIQARIPSVPDPIFSETRLAEIHDRLDADRTDLQAYAAIVKELGARRVLDVGCGTGTFACLLAATGLDVVGLDPAGASLEVARRKPHADRVRWFHGVATWIDSRGNARCMPNQSLGPASSSRLACLEKRARSRELDEGQLGALSIRTMSEFPR